MNKSSKNFQENGSVISLKHFIYLDRYRLTSYSSQLMDGIVQLRKLTESTGNRSIDAPLEYSREESQENVDEGEMSVGPKAHAGAITAKKINKKSSKKGFKESGVTIADEFSESFSEDKIDHDNAYIILERSLSEANLLCEVNESTELNQYPPFIKIKATARFFDWESIRDIIGKPSDFLAAMEPDVRRTLPNKKQFDLIFRRLKYSLLVQSPSTLILANQV